MCIERKAIERQLFTWLLILFCIFGGIGGYLSVGTLEDPGITLKSALVVTPWPGATAANMVAEVSEVLKSEIQMLGEVDYITSRNTPGLSVIEVHIRDTFQGTELPQVWNRLRARLANAQDAPSQGVLLPEINDSFGDIYGMYYAVTAPGFSDAELYEIATYLRREMLSVPGVAGAELLGLPQEAIFVEPDTATLANIGVPPGAILDAIDRLGRVEAPEPREAKFPLCGLTIGAGGTTFNLIDVAGMSRDRVDQPTHLMRHDGVVAFTLGISALATENIANVGARVEERLAQVMTDLPLGVDLHPIYEQHSIVEEASGSFLVSLVLSVAVVIGVLALIVGWRAAIVVGATLALTVIGTFLFMMLFGIKVERISLGEVTGPPMPRKRRRGRHRCPCLVPRSSARWPSPGSVSAPMPRASFYSPSSR
jgi:multidrug efflux pump subunit AcrB